MPKILNLLSSYRLLSLFFSIELVNMNLVVCCGHELNNLEELRLHSQLFHFERCLKQRCLFCVKDCMFSSWNSFRHHIKNVHNNFTPFYQEKAETQLENSISTFDCNDFFCPKEVPTSLFEDCSTDERHTASTVLSLNLLKDKHSVPDSVANEIFVKGMEASSIYVDPERIKSHENLRRVCASTYRQNKILDGFSRLSGREETVDNVTLHYVSIYETVKSLCQKENILKELIIERARKSFTYISRYLSRHLSRHCKLFGKGFLSTFLRRSFFSDAFVITLYWEMTLDSVCANTNWEMIPELFSTLAYFMTYRVSLVFLYR